MALELSVVSPAEKDLPLEGRCIDEPENSRRFFLVPDVTRGG